jgi:hypothetical protein
VLSFWTSACASVPEGVVGPAAEELTTQVETSLHVDAWRELAVVSWSFAGGHRWLWDKHQGMVRLQDGDGTAWLDLWDRGGVAHNEQGQPLSPTDEKKRLEDVYAAFINDSFWLNPFAALRNDGVTRSIVDDDGRRALLMTFASGGVTPGDSYLIFVDDKSQPTSWRMWVQVLPVKGLESSFEDWTDVGGARLAATHRMLGLSVDTRPIAGGATLTAVGEPADAFALLEQRRR